MPDREKAIRILEGNYKNFVLRHNGELLTVNELIALLKAQEPRVMVDAELIEKIRKAPITLKPAVDAVPVVRCRDCKYSDTFYKTTEDTMPLKCLNIRYGGVMPNWYCEHGERRESE